MGGRGKKPKFSEGQSPYFWFKLKIKRINKLTGGGYDEIMKSAVYGEIKDIGFEVDQWGTKRWYINVLNDKKFYHSYIYNAVDQVLDLHYIKEIEVYDIYLEHIYDRKLWKIIMIDPDAQNRSSELDDEASEHDG